MKEVGMTPQSGGVVGKGTEKEDGFTLIELILVIALGAMVVLGAMMLYQRGRDSAQLNTHVNALQAVVSGLGEYKMYKASLPAATGAWTGLENYVDTAISGSYKYNCASGVVTIETPALDDATQATKVLGRLVDQGTCGAGSATAGTPANKIDCIPPSLNGSAGC